MDTYKEIYIRLLLDTVKLQIAAIKKNGGSVKLINTIAIGAEKFLAHTVKNIHIIDQANTNLEILKRALNALRNLCLEIERNPEIYNIKIINKMLIKHFRIFFPCNITTKNLFKSQTANFPCNYFKNLNKVPSIKLLNKLIKKALSSNPKTTIRKTKWQKLKEQYTH